MKNTGDHGSVGEELLSNIPDIELKCNAVYESVKLGIFTLDEALSIYNVKKEEYLKYKP